MLGGELLLLEDGMLCFEGLQLEELLPQLAVLAVQRQQLIVDG